MFDLRRSLTPIDPKRNWRRYQTTMAIASLQAYKIRAMSLRTTIRSSPMMLTSVVALFRAYAGKLELCIVHDCLFYIAPS